MKKTIVILISLALLLTGLAACGTTSIKDNHTTKEQQTAETAENSTKETETEGDVTDASPAADEAVTVRLTGDGAEADSANVSISGADVVITGAGTYLLSGTLENGSIAVDAGKDDRVELVLNGVTVRSEDYAALYVKQADEVTVTLAEGTENTLSNGGSFVQKDDNDVDAAIFAKDDLTFGGTGTLTVLSPAGHGIAGKDELTFTGGVYTVTSAKCCVRAKDEIRISGGTYTLTAGTDGLHAENDEDDTLGNLYVTGGAFTISAKDDAVHANTLLEIGGGSLDITAAEGLEATYVRINDGDIFISATDDGINAAGKSTAYTPTVEINGGTLTIEMGPGDTDGVDSNGNIIITGGTVSVTGQSTFDYDGTAEFTGGTVIVNGQQVSSLPNQMMGGGMGGPGMGGGRGPWG